jgi:hypothetical protein
VYTYIYVYIYNAGKTRDRSESTKCASICAHTFSISALVWLEDACSNEVRHRDVHAVDRETEECMQWRERDRRQARGRGRRYTERGVRIQGRRGRRREGSCGIQHTAHPTTRRMPGRERERERERERKRERKERERGRGEREERGRRERRDAHTLDKPQQMPKNQSKRGHLFRVIGEGEREERYK